jgi:hypothetical protein
VAAVLAQQMAARLVLEPQTWAAAEAEAAQRQAAAGHLRVVPEAKVL